MSLLFRVAGYAAAMLAVISTAAIAGPSSAIGVEVISFNHGTSALQAADMPSQPAALPQPAFAAPVQSAPAIPSYSGSTQPAIEPSTRGRSLADLVSDHAETSTDDEEHECLAGAVYFESKGEPLLGQLAVAEVILNRAKSGRFPSSICGVVKQRNQFSFVRAGRFPPIARSSAAWAKAVAIASIALDDLADGAAPRAMFFHAKRVSPGWRGLTRIAAVGNHIFYR